MNKTSFEKQSEAVEQTGRLAKWFEREFGTIICRELRKSFMGTDLSRDVPWQNEWANQLGMQERCSEFAAKTARRARAMMNDPNLNITQVV